MDTRRLRIGVTAAAVLAAVAATASCDDSGGGPAGGVGRHDAPTAPARTSAPPAHRTTAPAPVRTTAPPARTTAPPARTDTAACFDGSCKITVTKPTTIRVDGDRFGFSSFKITRIATGGVTIEADSGGTYLQSGVSPGGTASLNNLSVHVASVHGGTAELELSARG